MTQVHTNYPTHNSTQSRCLGAILSLTLSVSVSVSLSNKKQNLTDSHFIHFSRIGLVSNVLARFPLSVRKTLITEVTSTLLSTSDLSLLSSLAHMKWAMEVLGQGFALPLEELSIAQETTQLYSQWLFEPQLRPLAFREAAGTADEQVLYQVHPLSSRLFVI